MNKITLIGNVVHTPQLRTTNMGVNVCSFSVAVRRRFKDQSGEYGTDFFEVQAWRQLADLCGKYLEKGRKVAVVGAMQSREYEKDGVKKKLWDVVADEVEFLTPRSEGATQVDDAPMKTRQEAREAARQDVQQSMMPLSQQGFTQVEDDDLPF